MLFTYMSHLTGDDSISFCSHLSINSEFYTAKKYYAESVVAGGWWKYYAEISIKLINCMYKYYAEMLDNL